MEVENKVRREYPLKYSQMTTNDANYFYNQKKTNMEIRNQQNTGKHVEKCPYEYTGHGDSYFVSKDMYNSLVGTCRCGRKKTEGHMIKCLQKVKNIYLSDDEEDENKNHRIERPLPSTSSGLFLFPLQFLICYLFSFFLFTCRDDWMASNKI